MAKKRKKTVPTRELIADWMKTNRYSQREFAAYIGVWPTNISKILAGTQKVSPFMAEKLIKVFGGEWRDHVDEPGRR